MRLARLSRLARIWRLLGGENKKALVADIVENRGQYALFITVLSAFMVLVIASLLVLQFESEALNANITTGGDALWWAIVTITTVGYGDKFPVTTMGRITATAVMFAGVGIIGALASILASILVPQPKEEETPVEAQISTTVETELAAMRAEIAALRHALSNESSSANPGDDGDRGPCRVRWTGITRCAGTTVDAPPTAGSAIQGLSFGRVRCTTSSASSSARSSRTCC